MFLWEFYMVTTQHMVFVPKNKNNNTEWFLLWKFLLCLSSSEFGIFLCTNFTWVFFFWTENFTWGVA